MAGKSSMILVGQELIKVYSCERKGKKAFALKVGRLLKNGKYKKSTIVVKGD